MNFYNLIILDASGSMCGIRRSALSGCNETIQSIRSAQKNNPGQKQFLTLLSFNSDEVTHYIFNNQPIEECKEIKENDYIPDACTPLYDAVGFSIRQLREQTKDVKEDKAFLVTIITDGLENASQHFSQQQIKSLIEELKPMGWTFAFIGANIDEVKEADNIGIHNTMAFCQDEVGTKAMWTNLSKARSKFFDCAQSLSEEDKENCFFKL